VNNPTASQTPGTTLTIRVRDTAEYVVVTLAGRIGITNAGRLRDRLFCLTDGGRPLVVDFDHVSLADAAGLGVLIGAANRLAAFRSSLYVVCTRQETLEHFELTGADRKVRLVRTVDEAVRELTVNDTAP
jgi:anti-anti-sigma factor